MQFPLRPRASWTRSNSRPVRQTGQVMVLFVIGAVVIVGMVGLGLDAGLSYMNRTALQGAADTASQTGARMLAADFQTGSASSPFTLRDITSAVVSVLDTNSAGPTVARVFTGFLVTGATTEGATTGSATQNPLCATGLAASTPSPGSGQCVVCQFYPATIASPPVPQCNGLAAISDALGPLPVDGVEVATTNSNPTPLLGVLGITHASQAANATSIFGLPIGVAPYAVWYDCSSSSPTLNPWAPQSGPPVPGDYVMYYNNKGGSGQSGGGYAQQATCGSPNDTDSSFKGDLHQPFYPVPPTVPGWFNAGGGTRAPTLTPISTGQRFLVPFLTWLGTSSTWSPCTGSSCPAPWHDSQCGPGSTFNPPSPPGHWDMCVVGYAYVQAVAPGCNNALSGTSTPCIAQILDSSALAPTGYLCDPVTDPTICGNVAGTQSAESVAVQLYAT